jgi:vacuolar iron transporter family protein
VQQKRVQGACCMLLERMAHHSARLTWECDLCWPTRAHHRRLPTRPPCATRSDVVKSIVFGGLDGVITTFSIVAASAGASLNVQTALLLGVSNLIADGISMGIGDFLSSHAELKFVKSEHKREAWEFENNRQGEVDEMVELYTKQGVSEADARVILEKMAEYPAVFLPHMVQLELGLPPVDEGDNPAKDGFVTFMSFLLFGSVPCIALAIMYGAKYTDRGGVFGITCAATVITMFALGATQAKVTRQPLLASALIMTINGSLAAASAYLVGWGLDEAFGGVTNGQ